jgi:hypothetical protein
MEAIAESETQKLIAASRREMGELREKAARLGRGHLEGGVDSLLKAHTDFIDGTLSFLENVAKVRASSEEVKELGRVMKDRINLACEIGTMAINEIKKGPEELDTQNKIKMITNEIRYLNAVDKLSEELINGIEKERDAELIGADLREFRKMIGIKKMD